MAATISLTGDWLLNIGNRMQTQGTGNLGTYATSGIEITPESVGLGVIQSLTIDPAAGYTFTWNAATGKVLAYQAGGAFTPAGTISKPSFTVNASGAIGTNMEIGLSADSAAATVEGGVGITAQRTLTTSSPVGVPTFTGGAGSVAVAEVANAVNLAGVTFNWRAIGY